MTSTPGWSSRMISSCSAWIVATMSRMPSPRGAFTAASRAASASRSVPSGPPAPGWLSTSSVKSTTRRPLRVELTTPTHVLGMRAGGDVEGARGRGAPVEQHRLVVLVAQTDPADVGTLAGVRVEPPEAQPVVRDVQPLDLRRGRAHRDVPVHGRLAGALQRRVVLALHPRAFRIEPRVQPGHVVALGSQFLVVPRRGHRPPHSAVRRRRSRSRERRSCAVTRVLPQAPWSAIR